MNRDRCDIVIPVWNNLEITRDCVDSIIKNTLYPCRLVIIDNASEKPTRDYLESLKKSGGIDARVITNKENAGFVGAVNQGMRFSDAPYVCVMNNDTVVTAGWLGEMIDIMGAHEAIGLINPSSNTSCQLPGKLDVDSYALTLQNMKGGFQELYTCRAFAMVVKRAVIEKIGYLDDDYGMGYYDDTDYSKRAQAAGYLTVRAKASYVWHRESQSFSKIKEKGRIFTENEKKFNARWGRLLRIGYVVPRAGTAGEEERIAANINAIAKSGHQVWVFSVKSVKERLKLIDHESIRFYLYPSLFFRLVALYKILKRRRKKRLDLILTNDAPALNLFGVFGNAAGSGIIEDRDYGVIEKEIKRLSFGQEAVF
ncbi:MAG: glycosyltransferase family 2 protein [Candidatus Omnitrophota bacterium]